MKLKSFDSELGSLIPIELNSLKFEPKRIFIVNNVPIGETRGNHAHFKTEQYLICLSGKINVILFDGINTTEQIISENEYVYVAKLIWDSQTFLTNNSTLLSLASTNYDVNDYIFDRETFIKIKTN